MSMYHHHHYRKQIISKASASNRHSALSTPYKLNLNPDDRRFILMLVFLIENGAFSTGHKFIYNRVAKRVLTATLMKKKEKESCSLLLAYIYLIRLSARRLKIIYVHI